MSNCVKKKKKYTTPNQVTLKIKTPVCYKSPIPVCSSELRAIGCSDPEGHALSPEESGAAAQGRESRRTKHLWHGWSREQAVPRERGRLSRGTNLCVPLVLSPRGVAGSPRCHRRGQKQYSCAWHSSPPPSSSTLCMHLLLPGPTPLPFCPFFFNCPFVFLLLTWTFRCGLFSLFSSVRGRTRLTHNWQLVLVIYDVISTDIPVQMLLF